MDTDGVVTASTDAGMLSLWCAASFPNIDGFEAWEAQVDDRLDEVISSGSLVPINIESDGAYGVRLATDPPALTERESQYAVVTSEPYLLAVEGGTVCLSGIEGVGLSSDSAATVKLDDGKYAVRVTIVAWDEEPGGRDAGGSPTADALPDFVVQITPTASVTEFRSAEVTFDPPE